MRGNTGEDVDGQVDALVNKILAANSDTAAQPAPRTAGPSAHSAPRRARHPAIKHGRRATQARR